MVNTEKAECERQEGRGKMPRDGAWAHGVASGKSRYAARGPMGESRTERAGK